LSLPRSYWGAFAVVIVLKPDYVSLFRNGVGRVIGTVVGGTLAALVVGGLHPDSFGIVVLVAVTSFAAYSLSSASFPASFAFITALVLILLSTTQVDTLSTAVDRLIDTVVGGAIALVAYVGWPTWSRSDAYRALAELISAERAYLLAALAVLQGRKVSADTLMQDARATRLAWSVAEATVGRSLEEPRAHRIDARIGNSVLSTARRIVQATHSLRLDANRGLAEDVQPRLDALIGALGDTLESIAKRLTDLEGPRFALQRTLRELYEPLPDLLAADESPSVVALQLDELVDAIDTLEAVLDDDRGGFDATARQSQSE
jgi:uncharacterized membrane protein YccC